MKKRRRDDLNSLFCSPSGFCFVWQPFIWAPLKWSTQENTNKLAVRASSIYLLASAEMYELHIFPAWIAAFVFCSQPSGCISIQLVLNFCLFRLQYATFYSSLLNWACLVINARKLRSTLLIPVTIFWEFIARIHTWGKHLWSIAI